MNFNDRLFENNNNNYNSQNNNNNNNKNNNQNINPNSQQAMFLNYQTSSSYPVLLLLLPSQLPQENKNDMVAYSPYFASASGSATTQGQLNYATSSPHSVAQSQSLVAPQQPMMPNTSSEEYISKRNYAGYPYLQQQLMPLLEQYQPPPPPFSFAAPTSHHHHPNHPVPQQSRSSLPSKGSTYLQQQHSRLIRTSSLPTGSLGSLERQHDSSKVHVELEGDLQLMTMNWTDEEIHNRRRLVMFKWQQQNSKIKVTFEPVSQEQYHPDMSIVSCIYDDKEKFLFTSVDFINFFENLANSKFKIEEKNRIRRNLQSLKPLTITKQFNKNLFTLIMAFGTPKPRNIEKNVKVFRWNCFQQLLSKIASKYSIEHQSYDYSQQQQQQRSSLSSAMPLNYQNEMLPVQPSFAFPFYQPMQQQQQQPAMISQQQQQQQQQQLLLLQVSPSVGTTTTSSYTGGIDVDQQQQQQQEQQQQQQQQRGTYYSDDPLNKSFYTYTSNFPY